MKSFRATNDNKTPIGFLPEDRVPVVQIHAVMSMFYAEHNIDRSSLIYKVFSDEPEAMRKHLSDLFKKCNYSCLGLLTNLDAINRVKLILYVMEQYKGFPIQSAEDYIKNYESNT